MNHKMIVCLNCKKEIEYWTLKDYIICLYCKTTINVEPCNEDNKLEEDNQNEDLNN